jgi:hypothetical protein
VKRALIFLAACAPGPVEPESWQLEQDRVVAVRVTPPGIGAGEHALVDALIAHADGPTTIATPSAMTAAGSPLFTAVSFLFDHYEVIGPDDTALADARTELGLAPGAPIPFELAVFFGPLSSDHFDTHKQMWLGEAAANPELPVITIDRAAPDAQIAIALDHEIELAVAADHARWLTSCGTLRDSDQPTAILSADQPCDGELVVVVRDDRGGTVWQVWPLRSQ